MARLYCIRLCMGKIVSFDYCPNIMHDNSYFTDDFDRKILGHHMVEDIIKIAIF